MKKRIRKKYLSEEEQRVLMLYNECENVEFTRYHVETSAAKSFVSILGKPQIDENNDVIWYSATKGKVEVTAFLRRDQE